MRKINKAFGAVRALNEVDLTLYPGEILGLVGDNSAGKSTLMKILTGAYQRDDGEILVAGEPVHFKSPQESRKVGIEMIYQDFALCGNMDVGQNIFLGRWPRKRLFVDRRKMYAIVQPYLAQLGLTISPDTASTSSKSWSISVLLTFSACCLMIIIARSSTVGASNKLRNGMS